MNFGEIVNFIKENHLEDCEFLSSSDCYDAVTYQDSDIRIQSNIEFGRLINILLINTPDDGWVYCGSDISIDAIFRLRSGDIPKDITNLIPIVRKAYSDPNSKLHGNGFDDGYEYLDESLDCSGGMKVDELLKYRYRSSNDTIKYTPPIITPSYPYQ